MKIENFPVDHFEDVLSLLICPNSKEKCFLGKCENCPKNETLSNHIFQVLKKNNIDNVVHKQWVTKPRTTLETSPFVHRRPTGFFLKKYKKNLSKDESLIICDFAENYAFVIQNAVPGFHWNNNQATIFPIVFYYRKEDIIEHKSLIIISDCLKHDAVAVFVFLQALNEYFSENHANIRKCIYYSDGAPQQFKNVKHFANIYHHNQDFNCSAIWNFQATAHGKGLCDGTGGTLKNMARKASLKMTDGQITTPLELYKWA